jgi:hypothetical protein
MIIHTEGTGRCSEDGTIVAKPRSIKIRLEEANVKPARICILSRTRKIMNSELIENRLDFRCDQFILQYCLMLIENVCQLYSTEYK